MTLKYAFMATVAALAFTSAAKAADAIVAAEPEPAEYVKVCDAFGKGYFYIPGTETCISLGGYIRNDIRGGDLLGDDTDRDGRGDTWSNRVRFNLNVLTAADTEYGALKTNAELRFNNNNGTQTYSLYRAYIDLAGLRVGKDESAFVLFPGKAGSVLQDDLIPYGKYETNLITYTFDPGNGFSAIAGFESGSSVGRDYVPNIVAGAKYKNDAFSIVLMGGYDRVVDEGAVKARIDGKFGDVSLFVMGAYNTGDVKNFYANWNGDWAVWAGGAVKINDKATANVQVAFTEADEFAAAANVGFKVASGLTVTPEVDYMEKVNGDKLWGGMVRFQRNF